MRMVIDPRCGRKTKHDHAEILTCLAADYLAGRNSIRRCLKWCENHIDFLKQHLEFKNGIASPATVSRILRNIDEEVFCLAFIEWMTGILSTKGINIAIDGKALRGSTEKGTGKRQEMLETKRNHWKIENSLHYVLDDLFREDRSDRNAGPVQ